MKLYTRSDGVVTEAIQFKSCEDIGNDGIFQLLTMLQDRGIRADWYDRKSTDEWTENEETGEPEEVFIPEHIKIVRGVGITEEGERVELGVDEANVNDYFVKRDGEFYIMAQELFEAVWELAVTDEVAAWEWLTSKRLPYSSKTGYWVLKDNPDIVSIDGGLHYFYLSERPLYQLHGPVYRSVHKEVTV